MNAVSALLSYDIPPADALKLLEYPELAEKIEDLKEVQERKATKKLLEVAHMIQLAVGANQSKKGHSAFVKWYRAKQMELEDNKSKKEQTVFDKLKGSKKTTVFDRLRGSE